MTEYEKSSGSLGSSDSSDGSSLASSESYFSSSSGVSMGSSSMGSSSMGSSSMGSSRAGSSGSSMGSSSMGSSRAGSSGSSSNGPCCVQINYTSPIDEQPVCAEMEYTDGAFSYDDILLTLDEGLWYVTVAAGEAIFLTSDECPHGSLTYEGLALEFGPCTGCGSSGGASSSGGDSSGGASSSIGASSSGGDSSGGGASSSGGVGSSGGEPPPNPEYTMTLIDEFGRGDGDVWYNGTFELVNTGNVDIIITGYEYILDSTGLDQSYISVPLPLTLYPGVPDYFYLYGLHDNDIIRIVDNYGINPTHPA